MPTQKSPQKPAAPKLKAKKEKEIKKKKPADEKAEKAKAAAKGSEEKDALEAKVDAKDGQISFTAGPARSRSSSQPARA